VGPCTISALPSEISKDALGTKPVVVSFQGLSLLMGKDSFAEQGDGSVDGNSTGKDGEPSGEKEGEGKGKNGAASEDEANIMPNPVT
jgi:hypothetical protein